MSTSDYLKIRLQILLALDLLRLLPLDAFILESEQRGIPGLLRDHEGLPIPIAEGVVELAKAAQVLVSCGPHARKPVESERRVDAVRRVG